MTAPVPLQHLEQTVDHSRVADRIEAPLRLRRSPGDPAGLCSVFDYRAVLSGRRVPSCPAIRQQTHKLRLPMLDLYRQMAIRQQKLHDYAQALWWAERGLAVYANDAARPEAVSDLRHRAARYQEKLGP